MVVVLGGVEVDFAPLIVIAFVLVISVRILVLGLVSVFLVELLIGYSIIGLLVLFFYCLLLILILVFEGIDILVVGPCLLLLDYYLWVLCWLLIFVFIQVSVRLLGFLLA